MIKITDNNETEQRTPSKNSPKSSPIWSAWLINAVVLLISTWPKSYWILCPKIDIFGAALKVDHPDRNEEEF